MSDPRRPCKAFEHAHDDASGADYLKSKVHNAFDVLPIQNVKAIDEGSTGAVILIQFKPATQVSGPVIAAGKVFEFAGKNNNPDPSWFFQEVGILQSLAHQNIIKCLAPIVSPACGILLMEFIPGGPLVNYIKSLTDEDIRRYFVQIACALRYIHSRRIVHRDVKPENIMIRQKTAIVIDFGLSARLPYSTSSIVRGVAGTPVYMAPEIRSLVNWDIVYDAIKTDSFSLGVTLWCMMLQKIPDIDTKFTPFIFPRKMDSDLTFCMRRLLRSVPEQRYDVTSLLAELVQRGYCAQEIEHL